MESLAWQLESLQFVGAVVAFISTLSCLTAATFLSWQIGGDIYQLAKDGIRAMRKATEAEPFAVNWEWMNKSLRQIAFMTFTMIACAVVGYFFAGLFAAYVIIVASGG